MTSVLGISAFYHDSAAALVVDGRLVAAAQEERFTRRRHDAVFPSQAMDYCLSAAALDVGQVDYVVFYEKPLLKFERLLETYLAFAPRGLLSFLKAMPVWLKDKLMMSRTIRRKTAGADRSRLVFVEHHEAHAASAFFPSPFDSAAILTLDGVGEWCTSTWGRGDGARIRLEEEMRFPHSLGLLYSAFTYHCGFRVNSGEYKLMGLAPYGQPVYEELIRRHLVKLNSDGSLWMDLRYFNYCHGLTMTNKRFARLFGIEPRRPESRLEQRHMDLAASVQRVTEDAMLAAARHVHARTGLSSLVLAGGVALNCVANGRLLREGPFERIWIQPAAGDAGGALGAALFGWHQLLEQPRTVQRDSDSQQGSLLGPSFTCEQIQAFLKSTDAVYEQIAAEDALIDRVVTLLSEGAVVGWFQGRMEFGPRALGARSILGDARSPAMQSVMNLRIKYRESFRPFAPIVTREAASDWFDLPQQHDSPYMLIVAPVAEARRNPLDARQQEILRTAEDLTERVKIARSAIPAVTHVDFSARIQTVDAGRNPRLHRLLCRFEAVTGCPVLVNTSFNVRGEPIVCTPQEAYQCFLATEMDALVLENILLLKRNQPAATLTGRQRHLAQFSPD